MLRFVLVLLLLGGCGTRPDAGTNTNPDRPPVRTPQASGTDALLIGISPVDARVVWVSGTGGTFARTLDGGATWTAGVVPGADSLQFRDVHAVHADTAYLLSAGPGALSRIYKTTDGGRSWTLQYTNPEPDGFFDCMDFWDAESGIAFSDAVGGAFLIVTTHDGGQTWERIPPERLPPAQPGGEGAFAASGTCVRVMGDSAAFIGTGAAATARVLHTVDRGRTWTAVATPIPGGEAAGITTLAFRDPDHGAILGGDIARPEAYTDNVAVTSDGGRTWQPAGRTPFPGAVYGAAYVPGSATLVAVGPGGIGYSHDDGRTWARLDSLTYWSVAFAAPSAGWAVGPEGRIVHLAF